MRSGVEKGSRYLGGSGDRREPGKNSHFHFRYARNLEPYRRA